jgi:SPP1 gp7 family putative phage head morphogenesis protein
LADDGSTNTLIGLSNQMAADIFKADGMLSKLPQDLLNGYAEKLFNAVLTGYNTTGNVEDNAMLNALKTNVYQFAAAKSYTQMKSLTEALLDSDGKVRRWSQFKQAAFEINNEQVVTWLQAEYNNALACSQMASKWQDIEANKAAIPYLQYVTAHDGRVRPAHAAMDGTVRLVDDAYWDLYYPPNGWNCRCTVKQIDGGTITPSEKLYHPTEQEVPKIFRFNPGKTQQVFSMKHPYFKDVPKAVLAQASAVIAKPEFDTRIEGKKGGYVGIHNLTDNNKRKEHIAASKVLADKGNKIKLMPEINAKDVANRKLYFPELKTHSNPDARFNGVLGDFKIPDSKIVTYDIATRCVTKTGKKGVSICAISLIDKDYKLKDVLNGIKSALKNPKDNISIREVWIILKDKSVLKIPRGIINNKKFYNIAEVL